MSSVEKFNVEGPEPSLKASDGAGDKPKWKRPKGKRAVVRWLKHFRYKKKKELERMMPEEKILYKLNKVI